MIWGRTYEQMYKERQSRLRGLQRPFRWFAWYPVQFNDGRWTWLRYVYVKYIIFNIGGELRISDAGPFYYHELE